MKSGIKLWRSTRTPAGACVELSKWTSTSWTGIHLAMKSLRLLLHIAHCVSQGPGHPCTMGKGCRPAPGWGLTVTQAARRAHQDLTQERGSQEERPAADVFHSLECMWSFRCSQLYSHATRLHSPWIAKRRSSSTSRHTKQQAAQQPIEFAHHGGLQEKIELTYPTLEGDEHPAVGTVCRWLTWLGKNIAHLLECIWAAGGVDHVIGKTSHAGQFCARNTCLGCHMYAYIYIFVLCISEVYAYIYKYINTIYTYICMCIYMCVLMYIYWTLMSIYINIYIYIYLHFSLNMHWPGNLWWHELPKSCAVH